MQKLAFILAAFIISMMAKAQDGSLESRLVKSKHSLNEPYLIEPFNKIKSICENRSSKLDINFEQGNPVLKFEEN